MHRPPLDGGKAARRADPSSLESRVSVAFRAPINARRALLSLRSGGVTQILPTENPPWSFAWLTGR